MMPRMMLIVSFSVVKTATYKPRLAKPVSQSSRVRGDRYIDSIA